MNTKLILWTSTLCLGLLAWVYLDVQSMHVYYNWHDYLVDEKTGVKIEPRQVIDMRNVILTPDDYVQRTNSMERLYDQVYQIHLEAIQTHHHVYSDSRALKLSGWPVSNQTRCGQQLEWINDQLQLHKDYQLLRGPRGRELSQLMDSFGKLESGTFRGITFWLGGYSQCLRVSLNGGAIRTRYCVAKMRPKWWPEQERVYPKSRIRIGACLPETCDTLSFGLHRAMIEHLVKLELPRFYQENLIFDDLFCLPDERSPIRKIPLAGQILLLLLVAWLSAICVASLLHAIIQQRKAQTLELAACEPARKTEPPPPPPPPQSHSLLDSTLIDIERRAAAARESEPEASSGPMCLGLLEVLSLQHIWRSFTSDNLSLRLEREIGESGRARLDMRPMNMLKGIMTVGILLGHSALLVPLLTRSLASHIQLDTGPWARLFMSYPLLVDTFFMLFGLLVAHSLHKSFALERITSPPVWFGFNLNIILRIGPLFMLTHWLERSLVPYLGAGPWWDYGTYKFSLRGFCMSEPWYKSIPYFGRLGDPSLVGCNGPAWFLVAYSQLGLVLPLVVYLFYRLPNQVCRLLLLAFLAFLNPLQLLLKFARQTVIEGDVFATYGALIVTLLEKFESTGTMATVGRIGPVAVGCYVGHLLRLYELGAISEWPRWLTSRITLVLAGALQLVVFILPLIYYWFSDATRQRVSAREFIISTSISNWLWLALLSIQLINWFTVRNQTRFARFASGHFWHLFNKLGLCVYLIHMSVLLYGVTQDEQAISHGFVIDSWELFGFGLVFSLLLAFIVHLLFETPLTLLLKRSSSLAIEFAARVAA